MDGRVKTLHPDAPRRHPRAPRPSRRPGGARRARHRPRSTWSSSTCIRSSSSREPGDRRSTSWSKQIDIGGPSHGPRGGQEFPRRARRRRSGGLSARCSRRSTTTPTPRVPVRARCGRRSRTPAHYDTRDRGDAGDGRARRRRCSTRQPRRRCDPYGGVCGSRSRRSATCDTARIPHQPAAWYPSVRRQPSVGFSGADDSSGQGALVHEPARPRRRRAHRPRVRRAGGGRRSSTRTRAARRSGDRPPTPTCARAMPTAVPAFGGIVGLNRADRCRRPPRRSSRRSSKPSSRRRSTTRRAAGARDEGEHARRRRPTSIRRCSDGVRRRSDRFSAAMLVQQRDRVVEAASPWSAGALPEGLARRHEAAADGEEWEALRFAWRDLRAREVEHGDLHRRHSGRSRSAPVR